MCRWGCITTDTTYMCKWCGTRYCKECLRGDFPGHVPGEPGEPTKCRMCNQARFQGQRVEYVPSKKPPEDPRKRGRGLSARGRAASAKNASKGKKGKKGGKKRKR